MIGSKMNQFVLKKHLNKPLRKKPKYRYVLSFGSNLGDKEACCQDGVHYLKNFVSFIRFSEKKITKPLESQKFDTSGQADYLNFVCEIMTNLRPFELYQKIRWIENLKGHCRDKKWQSRYLDIDILLWAKNSLSPWGKSCFLTYNRNQLYVPHNELKNRPFLFQLVEKDLKIDLFRNNF